MKMKGACLVVIFGFLTGMSLPDEVIETNLVIHPLSSVAINGKTTVNKYQCAISSYKGTDTLSLTAERGKGAYFKKGLARLNASDFDCGIGVITKDFGEIIQSEKYPNIQLDFISFERVPKFETSEEKFRGRLTVTLANVSVPCEVRCSIVKDAAGLIHLKGKRHFKFSDFNLKPPVKMMGLVKVNEVIEVDFHLVLTRQ